MTRVALVTGATSGIGVAIAERLAADGFSVAVSGRNTARGEAVAHRLGNSAKFFVSDLIAQGAADALVGSVIDHYGRLDVLVNNAAIDNTGQLLEVPIDEIRATFESNAISVIAMLQAGARAMSASGGGSIINITSRLASIGVPRMVIYGASKGAVKALTTGAAVELAPLGIRVNAVAPGLTRTPLYDAWIGTQDDPAQVEKSVVADIPLGRLSTPKDVAGAVSYLASPDSAHVTGITLPVDGGYTAR